MFHDPHEAPIALLKRLIAAWKARGEGDIKPPMSNATIADLVIAAHVRIGGPLRTGLNFDPGSADEYNRMKANEGRMRRLLDEEDEDKLLNANILPSIVAALPCDLKVIFWNEYLRHDDLCVTGLDPADDEVLSISHLSVHIKESSEAHQALADVIQNPTDAALERLERENAEAIEAGQRVGRLVRAMRRARTSCGAAIGKFLHRDRTVA